eukprot:TRINITY_DN25893_c0_g1_i1.p1 TRINITY_DN25893_c0_g1~~TRINITY_DN25893_c0_g1_i1.p1  ORF type:complete len:194 (-),score=13.68 TRINITY_DN25893_c0_g1_i1:43-624(-)
MAESLFEEHTKDWVSGPKKLFINSWNVFNVSVLNLVLQTIMWIGWWNFLAYWAWPWADDYYVLRDVLYIIIGITLKVIGTLWLPEEELTHLTVVEWTLGRPYSFDWKRKLRNFGVYYLHFLAFLFAWVGTWNVFDLYVYNCGYCWEREIVYILAPPAVLFLVQEGLSMESMYWLFSRSPYQVYDEESLLTTKK